MTNTRLEHDLLGERNVPSEHYYGIQTLRAVENFCITGISISHYPRLVHSLAYIKKAAAMANLELGLLPEQISQAIVQACDDILRGELLSEFVVDVIQGGAGTSTNMNAMEPVIAYNLFTSLDMLGRACRALAERCIRGITANTEHCRQMVENSIGLVTALNPLLGYEKTSQIAEEALRTGKSVVEVVLEMGYLTQAELEQVLSLHKMIR